MKKYIHLLAVTLLLLIATITQLNAQTNIALGKPVTAQATTAGSPANVVDGDTSTKWQSASATSQWIYVDLGVTSKVRKVAVLFDSTIVGWAGTYYVQVSDDAVNWKTIDSLKSNAKANTVVDGLSGIGRYARVLMGARAGTYYRIKELKVYGYPNVALNKAVTVSSIKSTSYQGYNATDGDTATKWWSGNTTPNEWLYVDLGRAYNIKSVAIRWNTDANNAYGRSWYIEVSNDAVSWTRIDTVTSNYATYNYTDSLLATGRYVRFYGTGRANVAQGYSVREFEVYGVDANSETACGGSSEVILSSLYPPSGFYPPDATPTGQATYPGRINDFKAAPLSCGDIVMIGNSITNGGGDWATRLCSPIVKNRGISGDVTNGVIARLGEIYYYKPSKVFILIGVNNLNNKYDSINYPNGYTAKYVADSICGIANKIHRQSPATKIYVQSLLPIGPKYTIIKGKIKATNDSLKAREPNQPYTFIDVHSLLADVSDFIQPQYTTDSLHLTEAGYRVWVKKLVDNYDITPLSTGNLAFRKPVTQTSVLSTAYSGSNAVDGDTATRWQSSASANNAMRVDLARTYNMQKIVIKWDAAAYGKNFNITASDDESNWDTIATVTNNTSSYTELNNLSGQGRYIRMNGIGTSGTTGYGIKEFEVYGAAQVLPARLLSFNTKTEKNNRVDLAWQTAAEINSDYFTVEKSRNGTDYFPLVTINSYGNGSYNYTYTDINPFDGHNYYRLVQTDKDGKKNYEGTRQVTVRLSDVSIYPNPVTNRTFTVNLTNGSYPVNLQLVDISGRIIYNQKLFGNTSSENINIVLPANIVHGVYILKAGAAVTKIVIEN